MDDDPFFELAVYLVASARLTLEEPIVYGSFRLVEAAIRTIDAGKATNAGTDSFLAEQRAQLEAGKLRLVDDPDGYADWLDEVLQAFTAEAALRNRTPNLDSSKISLKNPTFRTESTERPEHGSGGGERR
jgi:hypothetical protein